MLDKVAPPNRGFTCYFYSLGFGTSCKGGASWEPIPNGRPDLISSPGLAAVVAVVFIAPKGLVGDLNEEFSPCSFPKRPP